MAMLTLAGSAGAAETNLGGSGISAAWLNIFASPLEATYGQALGAMEGTAVAGRMDPSALADVRSWSVDLAHHQYVDGMGMESLAVGMPLGGLDGVGVSMRYMNLGSVTEINVLQSGELQEAGAINPYGLALETQWGRKINDGLRVGVGAGWIEEDLGAASGSAVQFSAGLGARFSQDLDASLSVTGLGSGLYGSLPATTWHASLAWQSLKDIPFRLGTGMAATSGGEAVRFSVTGAYTVAGALVLRAGWNQQQDGISGAVLGAGYHFGALGVDYAYQMGTALGATHLLGLTSVWASASHSAFLTAKAVDTVTEESHGARLVPKPMNQSVLASTELPTLSFEFDASSKVPDDDTKIYVPCAFQIRSNRAQDDLFWRLEIIAPGGSVFRSLAGELKADSMVDWDGKSSAGKDCWFKYDYGFQLSILDTSGRVLWQGALIKRRCVFRQ